MVVLGKRRHANPIIIGPDELITKPRRIPFSEKAFEEGWLQDLIEANPEVLPVADIEPVFAPAISVGREVQTNVGPIDNLFISPQGYLTIVETKLWRNPEARRQVTGQIIDYAKEVRRWSFEDLNQRVRTYNKKCGKADISIIDTLRTIEPIEEDEEPTIVDAVSRNIRDGRFLLLVVGDGIRESVEEMAEFLNQTPQLYFTLALVELQVYELQGDNDRSLLVITLIVARTKEITRAVVEIRGKTEGISVTLPLEAPPTTTGTISQEAFFRTLSGNVESDLVAYARKMINDMEDLGCDVVWKKASYVVKISDSSGSGELFTLFWVDRNGIARTFSKWLPNQLERILGLPGSKQIAMNFLDKFAELSPGYEKRNKKKLSLDSSFDLVVPLSELQENHKKLCSIVEYIIKELSELSEKSH
ncbi:hypothetical protein E3J38_09680 [candidate division TA06 bacterium]|uniref:DUF91 domain-containing protein n=1 Tax=candidate division TA06 bacterium TaxID=2250710 RepID=A0A523XEB9_UNCT6|nr:MAG: hypothetical protein E3J38_09680 [candidate division TA06 bacterium]